MKALLKRRQPDIAMASDTDSFWPKLAGGAFALWAASIPIGVSMLRDSLDKLAEEQALVRKEYAATALNFERRITALEARHEIFDRRSFSAPQQIAPVSPANTDKKPKP